MCVCETQSILKDGCVKHLYPLCRRRHREGIQKVGKQRRALQRQSNWGESWLFLILWGGCCIRPQNEPQQQRTTEDERGGCKGFKIFSKRTWRANDSKGTGTVLGELGNCKMNTDNILSPSPSFSSEPSSPSWGCRLYQWQVTKRLRKSSLLLSSWTLKQLWLDLPGQIVNSKGQFENQVCVTLCWVLGTARAT